MPSENKPVASIIIPVFNRADRVRATLDSVLKQSYRPLQLVFVDDGSTDTSLDILRAWSDKNKTDDFQIHVYSQPNSGAPTARNVGLSNSEGKYIQFLDSDDIIYPEKLEIQIAEMESGGHDLSVCDFHILHEDGRTTKIENNGNLMDRVVMGWSVYTATPVIRRDIIQSGISWRQDIPRNQDVEFFFKVFCLSKSYVHVPRILCRWVHHDGDQISKIYKIRAYPYFGLLTSAVLFYREFWRDLSLRKHYLALKRINNLLLRFLYHHRFNLSKSL